MVTAARSKENQSKLKRAGCLEGKNQGRDLVPRVRSEVASEAVTVPAPQEAGKALGRSGRGLVVWQERAEAGRSQLGAQAGAVWCSRAQSMEAD